MPQLLTNQTTILPGQSTVISNAFTPIQDLLNKSRSMKDQGLVDLAVRLLKLEPVLWNQAEGFWFRAPEEAALFLHPGNPNKNETLASLTGRITADWNLLARDLLENPHIFTKYPRFLEQYVPGFYNSLKRWHAAKKASSLTENPPPEEEKTNYMPWVILAALSAFVYGGR